MKPLAALALSSACAFGALPERVVVGYWQNWSPLRLPEIHRAYNVVELAFATTRAGSDHDLQFDLPTGYQRSVFLADLDTLHARGVSVILSVGGASDPVRLTTDAQRDRFVFTLDSILQAHQDKIDGIDLDFESTSMDFGDWTLANPAPGQTRIVDAVKTVMQAFRARTGRKLLLTMAPEVVYIQGGLSRWQTDNYHGGAWIPVIEELLDSLDLLMPQYYNAGGASGGIYAHDGKVYYDTGDPDFVTSMTETIILGFELLDGRGTFGGVPASKVAVGLPASDCDAAGSGYVKPESLSLALRYLRGEIPKPTGFSYTVRTPRPTLRGVMTWSINLDATSCDGEWSFATNAAQAVQSVSVSRHAASPIAPPDWFHLHDPLGRAGPSGLDRLFHASRGDPTPPR